MIDEPRQLAQQRTKDVEIPRRTAGAEGARAGCRDRDEALQLLFVQIERTI